MLNKMVRYGDEFDHAKSSEVPRADRIRGAMLVTENSGKPLGVAVHWDSAEGQKKLLIHFSDAMFLLSALKCIQLDTKTPFPDDPRIGRESRSIQ